jgi:hypothetical protein
MKFRLGWFETSRGAALTHATGAPPNNGRGVTTSVSDLVFCLESSGGLWNCAAADTAAAFLDVSRRHGSIIKYRSKMVDFVY